MVANDIKRLVEAAPGFRYREVQDSVKLLQACERWPLLEAVRRVMATGADPIPKAARVQSAAELWED